LNVPRVLLAGAFGQRNPGDDALLTAFTGALPGWEAVVPAANIASVGDGRIHAVPNSGRRALTALMNSDALVFAGGTLFKTLDPATGRAPHALLMRALLLARGARALSRPIALVGVGAGRLADRRSRSLARALIATADMTVLRDDASADILAEAGVPQPMRIGADAAWTLLDRYRSPRSVRTRGPLVVAVSRHAGGPTQAPALAAGVAELLRGRDDIDRIVLEPWQVGGPGLDDLDLARGLQRALRVATERDVTLVPPPESIVTASETYRDARLVIGQRFHSLVAAAAAGTRFVAVAHEAKLAELATRLGQPTLAAAAPVADIAPTLAAALDGPAPDQDEVAAQTERAIASLELMRTVVEGGRAGYPADLRALRLRPEAVIQ
jgi:polysaccharide pyruvyl transferase WcaK-like protein